MEKLLRPYMPGFMKAQRSISEESKSKPSQDKAARATSGCCTFRFSAALHLLDNANKTYCGLGLLRCACAPVTELFLGQKGRSAPVLVELFIRLLRASQAPRYGFVRHS